MKDLYDVIIVGAGPAGLSAAIYLARAQYRVLVLEKDTFGGQITITSEVVNYPGIVSIDGKKLTESMHKQAENFGAEFIKSDVIKLKLDSSIKEVSLQDGRVLECLGVVLAMGAKPRAAGFIGELEYRGRGVAYCATCDGEFFTGKDILVVGGGFAAVEESIFLTKYAKQVYVLVRGETFSCAQSAVDKLLSNDKIKVMFNTEIQEIGGEPSLQYAIMKNNQTGDISRYEPNEGETFGLFVFAGYAPATDLIKDAVKLTDGGYIDCGNNQKTNIDGVYGAGDICEKNLRQVVTAVSDGAVAATELEKYVSDMYDRLNLPKRQYIKKESSANEAAVSHKEENGDDSGFLNSALVAQLSDVFSKLQREIVFRAVLNDSSLSNEIAGFLNEFSQISPLMTVKTEKTSDGDSIVPEIRLETEDGYSGISFHAVPGGHEMNSFVIAIYNLTGPGQSIDDAILKRIQAISKPIEMTVLATLSCTMCPDLVMASQRIASLNPNIKARMVDINHFPDLRAKYNIMSVPALIINDATQPIFGKKNIIQLLDILETGA